MDIELVWKNGPVAPELEAEVVRSIRDELLGENGLSAAEELIFHTVFLGPIEAEGPEVMVWGVRGDHRFHCEYHSTFKGLKFEKSDLPESVQKLMWPEDADDQE